MDGFSYNNIFETKGIEYLIIIAFLLMIIPFWVMINRKPTLKQVRNALGVLSHGILRIPAGIHFSKNHTWAHLERSGTAEVGIDDFLVHITGEVKFCDLKEPGCLINKGELLAGLEGHGKFLKVYSPVSGKITHTNSILYKNPSLVSEDPYEAGWIYKIKPSKWIEESTTCFLANEAADWTRKELGRFKDFVAGSLNRYSPEASMLILQDGGELCDRPLADLPDEIWQDFQKSFLDLSS